MDVVCFDKTGTLTQDSTTLHSLRPSRPRCPIWSPRPLSSYAAAAALAAAAATSAAAAAGAGGGDARASIEVSRPSAEEDPGPRFEAAIDAESASEALGGVAELWEPQAALALVCAACHSLRHMLLEDGSQSPVGDPVEIALFEATGWRLAGSGAAVRSRGNLTALVVLTFGFSAELARMCAVVELMATGAAIWPSSATASALEKGTWVTKGAPRVCTCIHIHRARVILCSAAREGARNY